MSYKYDPDVNCIYFKFSEAKIVDTIEVAENIFCDYDQEQNIVGIELLDINTRQESEIINLDLPLSEENRKEVNNYFSRRQAVAR